MVRLDIMSRHDREKTRKQEKMKGWIENDSRMWYNINCIRVYNVSYDFHLGDNVINNL